MKKSIKLIGIIAICILIGGIGFILIQQFTGGNDGIESPPVNLAANISFTDNDPDNLEIGGTVTITRAVSESDISHYVLYWGSDPSTKSGGAIIELAKTGSDINYTIGQNTSISVNITHFLVYTKNDYGENATAVSVLIEDLSIPTERLRNGNFESGNVVWVQTAGSYEIVTDEGETYSGSWSAWLGGDTNYTDALYQEVTISVNATEATLSFWRLIESEDISGTPEDLCNVTIRDQSGVLLEILVTYSNLDDVGSNWYITYFDLSSYIGQTIRLCFESSNDSSGLTNFLFDDVSLVAND